jgi:DNA-binding SARP family transcriptional activator
MSHGGMAGACNEDSRIFSSSACLGVLDGFRLCCSGRELLPRPGEQRLLAFLAVRTKADRALVAGTLWPEVSDRHAMGSLRTALWRIRRLTPPLVDCEGELLVLEPSVSTDLSRLTAAIDSATSGRAESLDRLLDLRGDLLPGWYDDWVLSERARLRQLWLHAVEFAASLRLSAGDCLAALRGAVALVAADPCRESAHRLLIRVHQAEGNNQAAINQLDSCLALLTEDGVPPSSHLRQLADALRRPVIRPTPQPRIELPASTWSAPERGRHIIRRPATRGHARSRQP